MPASYFLFAGIIANVCGRFKRPMSSHDDHASCPQCRIAAGECNLDVHVPSVGAGRQNNGESSGDP